MRDEYIYALQEAIRRMHGCASSFVKTVPVKEVEGEVPVWQGEVEVFDLEGHGEAKQCYAWGATREDGGLKVILVLNPPIRSANDAVRAHIIRETHDMPPPL